MLGRVIETLIDCHEVDAQPACCRTSLLENDGRRQVAGAIGLESRPRGRALKAPVAFAVKSAIAAGI
jgi:hypothetical protein